jgi:hypothetical protein
MGKLEKLRFAETVRGRGSCSRSNVRRLSETEHLSVRWRRTDTHRSDAIRSNKINALQLIPKA